MTEANDLANEIRLAGAAITFRDTATWMRAGISARTIGRLRCHTANAYPASLVGAASIAPHIGTFAYDSAGTPALVVGACRADGEIIDIVAVNVCNPTAWRRRLGAVPALGLEAIDYADWMGEGLRLHPTPLDWLRADCQGAVILEWQSGAKLIAQIPRIYVANAHEAARVASVIEPKRNRIFIGLPNDTESHSA